MNAVCEVCGAIGYEHLLLCCSDCKEGHIHQYCLDKVLFDSTSEYWFCDECKQRHNEGSHSRSLEKVSSERPSNHARFDSTLQQPITKRLESAMEVEISDTVQNLRKENPKKRRRLILIRDDEEVEEKTEDVQQETVNEQPLMCNEPMMTHWINTEYYVEEAVQTGDINVQSLINGRPRKRRRRYIAENEDEDDIIGDECALNNVSMWSSNDSAKMVSQTPVAANHSLLSRPSDSECADRQYHICSQPLDKPVWSGVFKLDNEVILKLDAHLSNEACQTVHELSGLLQPVVEVRTLSRLQARPERWISSGPTDDSIGLFFLPHSSMKNDELTRLDRIIKSDGALQVTVGIVELLIFPSVLLAEQYHLFQGKHYLWGVFRQRNDIHDSGVHVQEQDGSAPATGEGQHKEHNLLVQQDEALYELSDKETFAVKYVVDAKEQLQMEGDLEVQNDTMKAAKSEGLTSPSSRYCLKKLDKISLLRSQLQEQEKVLVASADAEHKSMKIQHETLKTQAKEILEHRSEIASLEQEKNDLLVDNSTEKTQCQALQSQVEDLGKVQTALSGEKARLEAELKSVRSELEKCQIEVRSLRERIQTLEEKEVAWLGSEERHKAAVTASEAKQDKMILDKSAHDSEIKTFHADLEKAKCLVESYKSELKAAKLEKKAAVQKLKTSKEKAKCHLMHTLTSCSGYLLALVQSANPDFDPSSIYSAFRRPDPNAEALIERNMGIVWRFVQKFVTDVQRSLPRKRVRKPNTRIKGAEWSK